MIATAYFFFGKQGSGKSTQAELLAQELSLPYFNAGGELRKIVAEQRSELAEKISEQMGSGSLVDDELINKTFELFIDKRETEQGIVCDGFPRNFTQFALMEKICALKNYRIIAIEIVIAESTARSRIADRKVLHEGKLVSRQDDSPEVISERLAIYERETVPLLGSFKQKYSLIMINGEPPVREVFDELKNKLL